MKKDLRRTGLYLLTCITLSIFWIGLEFVLDGQVIIQISDTVMCSMLSWFVMDWVDYYIFER